MRIAFDIHIDVNLDDLIGRKEPILDALLERIRIDRLAKLMDVGNILRFLRGCGESNLGSG
jgi:hypothetical protein